LQPRSDIDRITQDGVVGHVGSANVADERFACANAAADAQARLGSCHDLAHDFYCGRKRSLRMIFALQGRAKKRHDLIADQLIQGAVVTKDRFRCHVVEAVELRGYVGGMELLREGGKPADIDK
jgi:hypothetical protein